MSTTSKRCGFPIPEHNEEAKADHILLFLHILGQKNKSSAIVQAFLCGAALLCEALTSGEASLLKWFDQTQPRPLVPPETGPAPRPSPA